MSKLINNTYYIVKPLLPRRFQLWLRRQLVLIKRPKYQNVWPILEDGGAAPAGWPGWPDNKKFAVVLTHDVELQKGHDRCKELLKLEQQLGFKSIFNFVPERYLVSPQLREYIVDQGFEVGVHGLNHDGKLFRSWELFHSRATKINRYLEEWSAVGFRSPAMHRNLDWIHELKIEYDLSTFDTDPFEPQSEGVGTIFPFWVGKEGTDQGYVELPYTLTQDFTPFILMRERTIDLWKKKVDWIAGKGGMILVNTHPDYMCFNGKPGLEEFPISMYLELLKYLKENYRDEYWHALPKDVAKYYRKAYAK